MGRANSKASRSFPSRTRCGPVRWRITVPPGGSNTSSHTHTERSRRNPHWAGRHGPGLRGNRAAPLAAFTGPGGGGGGGSAPEPGRGRPGLAGAGRGERAREGPSGRRASPAAVRGGRPRGLGPGERQPRRPGPTAAPGARSAAAPSPRPRAGQVPTEAAARAAGEDGARGATAPPALATGQAQRHLSTSNRRRRPAPDPALGAPREPARALSAHGGRRAPRSGRRGPRRRRPAGPRAGGRRGAGGARGGGERPGTGPGSRAARRPELSQRRRPFPAAARPPGGERKPGRHATLPAAALALPRPRRGVHFAEKKENAIHTPELPRETGAEGGAEGRRLGLIFLPAARPGPAPPARLPARARRPGGRTAFAPLMSNRLHQ